MAHWTWRPIGPFLIGCLAISGCGATAQDNQPARETFAKMVAFARLASVACTRLAPDAAGFRALALLTLVKPPLTEEEIVGQDLISRKPDVILASTTLVLQVLQRETQTIPIVFTFLADPVGDGVVSSLAHPGGNITGFTSAEPPATAGRSLELLTKVAPRIVHATVVLNPDQASHRS